MSDISVVIPTLDEEAHLPSVLRAARKALGPAAELIVVDGGSSDRTPEIARRRADTLLEAAPARGRQLDVGARSAGGDILIFLHADTRLAPGSARAVRRALARPGVVGGCHRFGVHPPAAPGTRWDLLEKGVRLRTRLFRTATGDQAIFATRSAFERAGGFPDQPLFEDVVFVRRLRSLGRFRPVDAVARTSRRRWEAEGFWATVGRHWMLRVGFALGVAPDRLAAWYEADGS